MPVLFVARCQLQRLLALGVSEILPNLGFFSSVKKRTQSAVAAKIMTDRGLGGRWEIIGVLLRFWSAIASMLCPGYMPLKKLSLRAP